MPKIRKTNAMRHLDDLHQTYTAHDLKLKEAADAKTCADLLGVPEDSVFKTLVTVSDSHDHFVFMLPANGHLSLKKAARAAGVKKIEMLPQKELFALTGYVHGGCSPIGMKKTFPTFIDQSAQKQETIYFSAGKIGVQIGMKPQDLCESCGIFMADLVE